MLFLRNNSWRLSGVGQQICWRKSNVFAQLNYYSKSMQDTYSRPIRDPCYDDPCLPCPPPKEDPCPCPKPPTDHPHADPRKLMFWKTLSLFVALPLIAIMSIVTYKRQKEKSRKPREPFLNLPYMCRRTKRWAWGDGNHSLFHNPVKNPIPPHGYEVPDPYAIPTKKN